MKKSMKEKGITLIALVITINILIILAGVTINLLLNRNGIIDKTNQAKQDYTKQQIKEQIEFEIANIKIAKIEEKSDIQVEDLNRLTNIGANIISLGSPSIIEYKGYEMKINDKYSVTEIEKVDATKTEVSVKDITDTGFTIVAKNRSSNVKFKYYVDGVAQNEEPTEQKEFIVTGKQEATLYKNIYVETFIEENVIESSKIEATTLSIWKIVLSKAGIDSTQYNDFTEAMTSENINLIANSKDSLDNIGKLFSNATYFEIIANNNILMSAICENSNARLEMYNNYTTTESIIANSQVALSAMQSSTRYVVLSKNIYKYAGDISFTTMYNDKAFVLGVSQGRNTDGGFKTEVGNLLSVSGGIQKQTANYTNATTGLKYRINKFASIVNLDPYGRDPSQSSIWINIYGYVAIFKI